MRPDIGPRSGLKGWPGNDPKKQAGPHFPWYVQVMAFSMILLAIAVGDPPADLTRAGVEPEKASASIQQGASLEHYERRARWAEGRLLCLRTLQDYRVARALALCGVEVGR